MGISGKLFGTELQPCSRRIGGREDHIRVTGPVDGSERLFRNSCQSILFCLDQEGITHIKLDTDEERPDR